MERRKIQLIAGTTYTVSLPKEWVKKNGLKEKSEISILEKNDRQLLLSPFSFESKKPVEMSLDIDEHLDNIDQIMFAVYYLGIDSINLYSNKALTKQTESKIRRALMNMSGAEITHQDKHKIAIKVLLDKSKIDIMQVAYRISLIIDSSISNIMENGDLEEIRFNENEIDRLYHLITKTISVSLVDSSILHSSKIKNVSLVPSYMIISKKLENIADNIEDIAELLQNQKINFENKCEILDFIRKELKRNINYIIGSQKKIFAKAAREEVLKIRNQIFKFNDKLLSNLLEDIIRYTLDIEEEIVSISFYSKLIRQEMM